MALQNRQVNSPAYTEPRSRGNGLSNFLSSVAVLLSTLALLCSGFAAYQVFTLRQTIEAADTLDSRAAIAQNQTNSTQSSSPATNGSNTAPASPTVTTTAPAPVTSPSPASTAQAPVASSLEIQPGQFVQPAFGTKGQVELLSVKRIKDPETGNRDVVNVQMRVRRVEPERVYGSDAITVAGTTARNPETSEAYKAVSFDRSTGSVSLFAMRPGASADAYVWLRVPESVNSLDVFVPDTAAFKNVPISN